MMQALKRVPPGPRRATWQAATALLLAAVLSACGGGGDGAAVSTMSATSAQYSRTMFITVNGSQLSQGVTLKVEGGCGEVTAIASYSNDVRQFSCPVNAVGPLVARAFDAAGERELASLHLSIPMPQVEVAVAQGEWTGKMLFELDPVAAPKSVGNFLGYVNAGFYRNTLFHRVIEGFVIQAGGFTAGPVVKVPTRDPVPLESANGLRNLRGTLAMARGPEADSGNAQWYVNLVDNASLDYVDESKPGYAVFGRVVSGLDAVDKIGAVPVKADAASGLTHLPQTNVVITSASQVR